MLQINKNDEPQELIEWKRSFEKRNGRKAKWRDLDTIEYTDMKAFIKEKLLQEQGYLCCYCCCELTEQTSQIEHYRPKNVSRYEHLDLEYTNLHAGCVDKNHCGQKKAQKFDEEKMISPLSSDAEESFDFHLDGEIYAYKNSTQAEYTKKILNLNENKLVGARKAVLCTLESWESGGLSAEEINQYIDAYCDGKKHPFLDVIRKHMENETKIN